jgi:uncharacterized protein (TIGR02594 family)
VSIETVMARIGELNSMMSPQLAQPTATPPPPAAAAGGAQPSQFASMLQGAMTPAATSGVGAVAAPGGSLAQRMIAIAQGEIGVREQPSGSNDSPRIAEYRSATAGAPGPGPWCAYFVSWVARQAGAPLGQNGQGFGAVDSVWAWAQQTGRAVPRGQQPQPGDLIVFNQHIGLVESVDANGAIHTIEGNSSDQVTRRTHSPSDAIGYVRLQ